MGNKLQGGADKQKIRLELSTRPFKAYIGELEMDFSDLCGDWDSNAFPDDQVFEIRSQIKIKNGKPVRSYYFFPSVK